MRVAYAAASSRVACAVWPSCQRNSVVRRNMRGRSSHRTTFAHWFKHNGRSRYDCTHLPRYSPITVSLVGRGDELRTLEQWGREAAQGQARIALVRGEAGVGKSRLVDEFLRGVDARTRVLRGRCQEDASVPYLALANALGDIVPAWSE